MMSDQIVMNICERGNSSADELRAKRMIPAVFYGPQEDSVAIAVNHKDFLRVWDDAGESTIIVLKGVGDDKEALIKDVQWHPLTDEPIHVDFYVFERGKKLSVTVPIEFVGEAPAEKLGGNVNKTLHELEIEVRPSEIPQHIEVDLSALTDLSSVITVGDLKLPESAVPKNDLTDAVASVSEAVEENFDAPVDEVQTEDEQPRS